MLNARLFFEEPGGFMLLPGSPLSLLDMHSDTKALACPSPYALGYSASSKQPFSQPYDGSDW